MPLPMAHCEIRVIGLVFSLFHEDFRGFVATIAANGNTESTDRKRRDYLWRSSLAVHVMVCFCSG
jgi:hypothetical protein